MSSTSILLKFDTKTTNKFMKLTIGVEVTPFKIYSIIDSLSIKSTFIDM